MGRSEQAFGTLYTAAEYRWPHQNALRQSFADFREDERKVYLGLPAVRKRDVSGG